jgi:bleomycin hydrolase
MGAQQSKINEAAMQEKLVERLRALEIRKNEREYIMVEKRGNNAAPPPYAALSRDVSISSVENWTSEILADSKNRLAMTAFTNSDAKNVLKSRRAQIQDQQVYVKSPLLVSSY